MCKSCTNKISLGATCRTPNSAVTRSAPCRSRHTAVRATHAVRNACYITATEHQSTDVTTHAVLHNKRSASTLLKHRTPCRSSCNCTVAWHFAMPPPPPHTNTGTSATPHLLRHDEHVAVRIGQARVPHAGIGGVHVDGETLLGARAAAVECARAASDLVSRMRQSRRAIAISMSRRPQRHRTYASLPTPVTAAN